MTTEDNLACRRDTIHNYVDKIADTKVLRFIEALLFQILPPDERKQTLIHV